MADAANEIEQLRGYAADLLQAAALVESLRAAAGEPRATLLVATRAEAATA